MNSDSIEQVADQLVDTYNADWASKENGRFILSRDNLLKMLGIPRLHPNIIRSLTDAMLERGLALIDMEMTFGVIAVTLTGRWRKLPRSMAENIAAGLDGELDDDGADEESETED
jgi:hypothetical protein